MHPVTRSQTTSLPFSSPPGKVYTLKNISGRLQFDVSPATKKSGDLIYRIKKVSDGRRYIGSTKKTATNTFASRLSKYHTEINSDETKQRQHVVHALRRSPRKFTLKVLAHKPGISEANLLKLEETWQDTFKTRERKHGYNHSKPTSESLRTKENRPTALKKLEAKPDSQNKSARRLVMPEPKKGLRA